MMLRKLLATSTTLFVVGQDEGELDAVKVLRDCESFGCLHANPWRACNRHSFWPMHYNFGILYAQGSIEILNLLGGSSSVRDLY